MERDSLKTKPLHEICVDKTDCRKESLTQQGRPSLPQQQPQQGDPAPGQNQTAGRDMNER